MMAEELKLQEYCSTTALQKNMPGESGEQKDAEYSVVFTENKLNHGEVNNSEYPTRPIFHAEKAGSEYHAPKMMHESAESAKQNCAVSYLLELNNVEQKNAKRPALPQKHEIKLKELDNPEVPNKHLKELEKQEDAEHSTVPHNYKIKLEEHHNADDPALKNKPEIKLEEHQDVQYSDVPHNHGIKLEEQQEGDHLVIENTQEIKIKEQENGKCPAVAHYHEIDYKEQQDDKYPSVPHLVEIKHTEQKDAKYPAPRHIHEIKIEEDLKAEGHASLNKEFPVAILHKTMPDKVKYAENLTHTNLHKMNYNDGAENTTPPIANDFVTKEEKDTALIITPDIAQDAEASALLIEQPIVSDKPTEAGRLASPIFQKIREQVQEPEFPVTPMEYPIKPEVINTESGDDPTYYELIPQIVNVRIYSTFDDEWDSASDNDGSNHVKDTEDKFFRRMKGREYYNYYQKMKVKEYHTLYPHGKITLPLGAVLHFWTDTDNLMREDIKEALLTLGADIAFIDYQMGDYEGWIRLKEEFTAQVILEKMKKGKIKIAESDVFFRVLTGKEQRKYLKRTAWDMLEFRIRTKGLKNILRKHGYKYVKKFHE